MLVRTCLLAACVTASLSAQPKLAPLTGLPPFPSDNPPTAEKIELGRALFFETELSGDGRRSCSSCHKPELYFTDGFSKAWGLHELELRRKTPSVLNVGWQRSMFFDGRVDTLEEQASKPLENPLEMNLDPAEAAQRIGRSARYQRLFEEVFPGQPITFELIAKAMAAYERTLISVDSDLDRYLLGDKTAMTEEAVRGMELFTGRAGCIRCHNGPMLTDHQLHYTGVPETRGDNAPGTRYKTQSLRDVMRRYSYMHNGEMLTLDAVFDHYEQGGSAPEGLDPELKPVVLSQEDREYLLSFLRSLDGRVNALLDQSPPTRDRFTRRSLRTPLTGADEVDASGSPILDPNYVKRPPTR